jgi:hypothetical protein
MASDPILPLNTRTRSSTLATDRLSVLVRHVSPDPSAPVMPKSAQTPAACGVAAAADSQPIDVSGTPAQPAGGLYSSLSQAVGRGWRSLRSEVAAELQLRHLRNRPEEARQLVQLDRSASVAEIHHALVEDGAVIIRELIDPATVDRVRQELAEITESQKAEGRLQHTGPPGSFVGDKTERTREFLHRSRAAQELLTHPVVISAMERLMGANCKRFRLKVATHIDIGPGETAQPLHREDGLYPAAHPGSEWCCDCMWALSDFTPENGATHIVRASHKGPQDTSGRVGYEHTAQAAMPKGSCLIFTGAQKRLSVPIMLYSHPNICQDRLGTDTHRTF